MKVAILGCGPVGLVAAHSILNSTAGKAEVRLFSVKRPSPIFGAQYLHQPIPGLVEEAGEPRVIRYRMSGSPEDYLRKVYGEMWDGHISDDLRDDAHVAWDLRGTYKSLWTWYSDLVQHMEFRPNRDELQKMFNTMYEHADLIINTIPRKALCVNSAHQFRETMIWASGDSTFGKSPIEGTDEVIDYNGTADVSWYRVSRMFGHSTVEWPGHIKMPLLPGVKEVRKPLSHNCDCWPSIKHLGRYGRWDRERLVHEAYADAQQLMFLHESEEKV